MRIIIELLAAAALACGPAKFNSGRDCGVKPATVSPAWAPPTFAPPAPKPAPKVQPKPAPKKPAAPKKK